MWKRASLVVCGAVIAVLFWAQAGADHEVRPPVATPPAVSARDDLLSRLPPSVKGVFLLDWKQVTSSPAFAKLEPLLLKLIDAAGGTAELAKMKMQLRDIEAVAVTLQLSAKKRDEPIIFVRGSFDKDAIEAALRATPAVTVLQVGGRTAYRLPGPRIACTFLERTVIGCASARALPAMLAVTGAAAGGSRPLDGLLAKIDASALLFGVLEIPEVLRKRLGRLLRPLKASVTEEPQALGFSLAEDGSFRAFARFPSSAQVGGWVSWVTQLTQGLQAKLAVSPLPPQLLQLAQSALSTVSVKAQDEWLLLTAKLPPAIATMGMLVGMAAPAFEKYALKSKTAEATMNIRKIYDSSVSYFEVEQVGPGGAKLPKHFPRSAGPTPPDSPCDHPGKKYPARPQLWFCEKDAKPDDPCHTWSKLNFAITDPHYYRYVYVSNGSSFTVRAHGDLNCNGVWSTFERIGYTDSTGNLKTGGGLYKYQALE